MKHTTPVRALLIMLSVGVVLFGTLFAPDHAAAAGWTTVYRQDFTTAATETSFDSAYAGQWCAYTEGEGGKSYHTYSAHDGLMDLRLDGTRGAAGSFGNTDHCANVYGRYTIRAKVTDASGYGAAFMLWPNYDVWGNGEVDYPEGDFNTTFAINQHTTDCTTSCPAFYQLRTAGYWWDWHTFTTEWTAAGVTYYLDGSQIGATTTNIPRDDHRMTIQMAPTSATTTAGHLYVDYVQIDQQG